MTTKFHGKVISVESVRYPNWWLDADPKVTHNSAIETKMDISEVDKHFSAHWKVKYNKRVNEKENNVFF